MGLGLKLGPSFWQDPDLGAAHHPRPFPRGQLTAHVLTEALHTESA